VHQLEIKALDSTEYYSKLEQ